MIAGAHGVINVTSTITFYELMWSAVGALVILFALRNLYESARDRLALIAQHKDGAMRDIVVGQIYDELLRLVIGGCILGIGIDSMTLRNVTIVWDIRAILTIGSFYAIGLAALLGGVNARVVRSRVENSLERERKRALDRSRKAAREARKGK